MAVTNSMSGKTMPYFDGLDIKVYQHPVPEASKEVIRSTIKGCIYRLFGLFFFFFFS